MVIQTQSLKTSSVHSSPLVIFSLGLNWASISCCASTAATIHKLIFFIFSNVFVSTSQLVLIQHMYPSPPGLMWTGQPIACIILPPMDGRLGGRAS
jgi:hypothetical protein